MGNDDVRVGGGGGAGAGIIPHHGQVWTEFFWGNGILRKCSGEGGQEKFWSILVEVFSSEWLLQAELVTNRPCQLVTALE